MATETDPNVRQPPPSSQPPPAYPRIVNRGRRATPRPIIRGQDRGRWLDFYQDILRAPWWAFFLGLAVIFFIVNLIFAAFYMQDPGGISDLRPGDFWEAFFFSALSFTTAGTGAMAPIDTYSNIVVTVEGFFGVMNIAVATGVLFVRISRPTSRMMFSKVATVTMFEGQPTLMFRVANQRGNSGAAGRGHGDAGPAGGHPRRPRHAPLRGADVWRARARPCSPCRGPSCIPSTPLSPLANATLESMLDQQMEIHGRHFGNGRNLFRQDLRPPFLPARRGRVEQAL